MFLLRTGAIEGLQALVAELGENPVTIFRAAGLTPAQTRDPDSYVSYGRVASLLELAAERCAEPLFGLRLSQRQTSSVLGDLALTISGMPTLGVALASVNRYLYLHARGASLGVEIRDDRAGLSLSIQTGSGGAIDQLMQLSLGQLANFIAEALSLSSPRFPLRLRQSAPPQSSTTLDTALFSRLAFDAKTDEVVIPGSWLDRPPRYDEANLRNHFENHLSMLQARYPNSLQDQVREVISATLASGECRLEQVASALGLHPRVLQKRLKAEGVSYAGLLQQTRQQIAEHHLRQPSISVTDLALTLGYAELAVFSRHFKRWTGESPMAWRQRHTVR